MTTTDVVAGRLQMRGPGPYGADMLILNSFWTLRDSVKAFTSCTAVSTGCLVANPSWSVLRRMHAGQASSKVLKTVAAYTHRRSGTNTNKSSLSASAIRRPLRGRSDAAQVRTGLGIPIASVTPRRFTLATSATMAQNGSAPADSPR